MAGSPIQHAKEENDTGRVYDLQDSSNQPEICALSGFDVLEILVRHLFCCSKSLTAMLWAEIFRSFRF